MNGRPARLVVFALAVVGGLVGLATLWMHLTGDPLADTRAYYDAAARLNAGGPLYPPGADTNLAGFYHYPRSSRSRCARSSPSSRTRRSDSPGRP